MTELLFATEIGAFNNENGILVCNGSSLSPYKVRSGRCETALFSFLDQNRNKPTLSDIEISPPNGYTVKRYIIYITDAPNPPSKLISGKITNAGEYDLSSLITLMFKESAGITIDKETAERFSQEKKKGTFLWQDNGVCAMARIAFEGAEYARINCIVTPSERRGNGYASMLVYSLTDTLTKKGKKVTVLADAENPVTNSMYQKLGFSPCSEIFEYTSNSASLTDTALTISALS